MFGHHVVIWHRNAAREAQVFFLAQPIMSLLSENVVTVAPRCLNREFKKVRQQQKRHIQIELLTLFHVGHVVQRRRRSGNYFDIKAKNVRLTAAD